MVEHYKHSKILSKFVVYYTTERNMNLKYLSFTLAAALMLSVSVEADASPRSGVKVRRQALDLYEKAMYEPARELFEQAADGGEDAFCEGYAVLCALRTRSADCESEYLRYTDKYKRSTLLPRIRFEHARILFDEGALDEAEREFALVRPRSLDSSARAELAFKQGWCRYKAGDYQAAREHFLSVDKMPLSDFTAPSRYLLGFISYSSKDFSEAIKWFSLSEKDARFEQLSRFYLADCQFMRKNYDYILTEGLNVFEESSSVRQMHLARQISEAYLVRGDIEKAREFYDKVNDRDKNRSDHFFSGSMLFAVKDYAGAIGEYQQMQDRTDSLGQVANYQMGYSYIQTKNKVAALDAFKDASNYDFNYQIKEDATFNYAKLAFDLNKDGAPFAEYLREFPNFGKKDRIYGYIALAALYDNDYAAAVEAYDNVETLDEDQKLNYAKANYLRAAQLVAGGSWRDAVPYLKAAAFYLPKNDPFNQLARFWLAECYYHAGDYKEALAVYKELYNISALDGKPEGAAILYNVGYCHYLLQSYSTAEKWFDQYILAGDRTFREDALTRRADCDFARRKYKAAAASYSGLIEEYPEGKTLYPYYQRGLSLGLAGDLKGKVSSLAAVRIASPAAPYYCESLYELGRAYLDLEDYKNATSVFSQLRRNAADSTYAAKAIIGLGMTCRNSMNYDKALGYYKYVVSQFPGSEVAEDALLAIESIYQTRKEPEKYLDYVEKNALASGKSPQEREQMYFNAAEQLFLAQKYPQAIEAVQKYQGNYPEGEKLTESWFYLAESYRMTGDKERACDAYEKVLSSETKTSFNEMALLGLATQSYALERYTAAFDAYEKLLEESSFDSNKSLAKAGMMRSAYRAKNYLGAVSSADLVLGEVEVDAALKRECLYVKAKSLISLSRRSDAFELLGELAREAGTPEGGEARFIIIQDAFDKGEFDKAESLVYEFSSAGADSYWLARAFIVLGDCFVEKGNEAQAKATWESVRDGYVPSEGGDDIMGIVNLKLERLNNE